MGWDGLLLTCLLEYLIQLLISVHTYKVPFFLIYLLVHTYVCNYTDLELRYSRIAVVLTGALPSR